jgi:hypothetical protein
MSSACKPATKILLLDGEDAGKFAAAAILDIERYRRRDDC